MNGPVRRVTPLTVLADIGPTVQQYLDLGFEAVDTGSPECVGLRAGHTYQLVATKAFMERQFRPWTVALLLNRTTPYIYVQSLDEAKSRLAPVSAVVEQSTVREGTREAVIETDGQYIVLAEKVGAEG
ncbi:MAG: hypothetical protein HY055_14525 [Magnetospirillum sp.]|nr:hypothetical protein [Magnetospirillum sp.]